MSRSSLASFAYSDPRIRSLDGHKLRMSEVFTRRGYVSPSSPASVLIVSENSVAAENTAEKLNRDSRIRVRAIASPDLIDAALKRFKPDVVITDKWFERGKVDYRDVVMPFIDRNEAVRLVMLDDSGAGSQADDILTPRNVTVCPRVDALKGSKLADMILQAKAR